MGNCLVTKLNGVVDNDSLPRLNIIYTSVSSAQGQVDVWAGIPNAMKVTILSSQTLQSVTGDCAMIDSKSFYAGTFAANARNFISNPGSEVTLKIENKYDWGYFRPFYFGTQNVLDIDQFRFYNHLTQFIIVVADNCNVKGSIESFIPSKNSLKDITISGGTVSGDIGIFKDFTEIETISVAFIGLNSTAESFASVGKIANKLKVFRCTSSTLNGSLEDFVAVARQNGVTEKNNLTTYFEGITFNGVELVAGGAEWNSKLSWTADTITYHGITINA